MWGWGGFITVIGLQEMQHVTMQGGHLYDHKTLQNSTQAKQ